jgi:Uma2 family endonuclease
MSPQEYLEWEPKQELRYEYVDGEIFAMTGGTKPHNRIAGNLYIAIDIHLGEGGCDLYMSDVKVQISPSGPYHYPDIVVTCDAKDRESNQAIEFPCLIIEVLSPSTESYDRGAKFNHYRKITTLQEYVLVQADAIGVECFRRNEKGLWVLYPYEAGGIITLESIGLSLPIEALYRQVRFDMPENKLYQN